MRLHQHRIDLCNRVLVSVQGLIPCGLFQDVHDYINKYNEWGVGIEFLIDYISEFEIKISREQFRLISDATASMGLDDSNRIQYLSGNDVVG